MRPEIYKDEGYKLMGAGFEVYRERGFGLAQEIYHECMEIELELRGISFISKNGLACFYKGRELKKRYVPDLLAFGVVVAELKSVNRLLPDHQAQLMNHLRLTKLPVGYLINFGRSDMLEWQRVILSEYISVQKLAGISVH